MKIGVHERGLRFLLPLKSTRGELLIAVLSALLRQLYRELGGGGQNLPPPRSWPDTQARRGLRLGMSIGRLDYDGLTKRS